MWDSFESNTSSSEDEDSPKLTSSFNQQRRQASFISRPTSVAGTQFGQQFRGREWLQSAGGVFADEQQQKESRHGFGQYYRLSREGGRAELWCGNPGSSRSDGNESRKIIEAQVSPEKKKRRNKEKSEESDFRRTDAGQFSRSARINMDHRNLPTSYENFKTWRGEGNDSERPNIEEGVCEIDTVVEDDIEVNRPQTARDKMRKFVLECLHANPLRYRIVHDVFAIQDERYSNEFVSRVCESTTSGKYKGSILWVCNHANDHLHVVHDCAYTGGTCRCQRIKELREHCGEPRLNRRVIRSSEFTAEHWLNLAIYFETGERTAIHFEIAGRTWTKCGKVRSLSIRKNPELGQEALVEACRNEDDLLNIKSCGSCADEDYTSNVSGDKTSGSYSKRRKGNKGDKLLEFFWRFPTAPIGNIFNTSNWFSSTWKYLPLNNNHIKAVQRIFQRQICDMSLREFIVKYKNIETPYFNCGVKDINDYYYNLEHSVNIANELLLFQFNNEHINVKSFLTNLYNLLEKNVPKKNCMFILSPPNAGKNYFFDAVLHYFLNFGQIGNFNKYNNFPLMECVNRRVILWNEPHCETSSFETIKMLFGGDTLNVKVKFLDDAIVNRTPVIVLSNNDIFPKDTAFRTRMYFYMWKSCASLKRCKKKLLPLILPKLFEMYKIIDEEGIPIDDNENSDSSSDNEFIQ